MDIITVGTSIRNGLQRRAAANAISLFCLQSRTDGHRFLPRRLGRWKVTILSSKLGTSQSRCLLAYSAGRSAICSSFRPLLFRPTFHLRVTSSANTLFRISHELGRCYSVKPQTRESLSSAKPQDVLKVQASLLAQVNRSEKSVGDDFQQHAQSEQDVAKAAIADRQPDIVDDSQELKEKSEVLSTKAEEVQESSVDATELQKPGLLKRFHMMYKQYGVVLVGVHTFTAAIWTGMFYYAAVSGIDVVPILRWFGASESIIKPFLLPGVGHAAVTYLLYKLATPARYTVTIFGTQLAVRYLRRWGYLKQPEVIAGKPDSLKSLVKDGRVKVQDKMEDIRDEVHELKGKIGTIRSPITDSKTDKRKPL